MIYIDTSSLLKLLHLEPESGAVRTAVSAEAEVIVSTLAELETRSQLKAAWHGGDCTKARYLALVRQLDALRELEPFRFTGLPGTVFTTAIRQDRDATRLHLRSLDRLHLGAMEELGLTRVLTNDWKLALAARSLGLEAVLPGME